ncbi:alpha/beta fold hydrolase [Ottowia testudinis]|uniref:Alpha/beta fold hydrolase n=1 Tax=Ottowia testudinis TaxID=2816950 RepID=A0A975CHH9_9BURK|nr:alpha/beta fold hydrolase [Ottowia testudinis]QTD45684.1 alpha/beta fold hydrolase [Ottowia testudinis]
MRLPTYTMLGHGPVVLMLHGAGGGFRSFAPQVETLASLGFRAVAWNMPGYGQSAPIEPYGFKGLAESAIALIESLAPVTGGAPLALLGQGMGAMVAQEVVLRRPDLIGQLVLVTTAAAVLPGDGYSRHAEQGLAWLEQGQSMDAIAGNLLPQLCGPGALPAGVQLAAHCQAQVPAATWRRALQALASFDRRAALGLIHVPALLVAGQHDPVTPPASMQAMAAAITGAQCVTVPHSGHLPHLERPEEFDTLLLGFLRHARAWLH